LLGTLIGDEPVLPSPGLSACGYKLALPRTGSARQTLQKL